MEFLSQVLHPDVLRQADDLDRLDAIIDGGAQNTLEQLLADAAAAIALLDRECRLGVDVAPEWRLTRNSSDMPLPKRKCRLRGSRLSR